ncbi:hypothetical protein MNBD_CHLOROFLEXI01-2380 [hydrothermal vent metagenome]|uniref:HNH domain-containing protein n=1 Tax=hydrothermal vent metagenome TaxID=652676 RepID=A0A3B0VSW6_9ZZZZ
MRFSTAHRHYFSAKDGAYSRVTEREFFDSQITLSDAEAELAVNYFGTTILVGNVGVDKEQAKKPFKLYKKNEFIYLNLVFPKLGKNELRLYISKRAGFKPPADHVWFLILDKSDVLNIGSMLETEWRRLGQDDKGDVDYQLAIEQNILVGSDLERGEIKTITLGERKTYYRDPRIARARFELAKYKCEFDSSHTTFPSTKGHPFVEAHHFIGISLQERFTTPLDTMNNVFALCPTCHKAIHYARIDYRSEVVSVLFRQRPFLATKYALTLDQALQFYNCDDLQF